MANNKVQLADGTVLIDLTSDTAEAEHVLSGYTFHDKSGAQLEGTLEVSGGDYSVESVDNGDGTQDIYIYDSGEEPESTIEPLYVTANGTNTADPGKRIQPSCCKCKCRSGSARQDNHGRRYIYRRSRL